MKEPGKSLEVPLFPPVKVYDTRDHSHANNLRFELFKFKIETDREESIWC